MRQSAPFHHPAVVLDALPRTHRRVGIIPGSDATLRYVLPIPRGWGRVSGLAAAPAQGRSELLGLFSPRPDLTGPRVMVSVTRLRWEVDPISWVRHGWETAGWTIATATPLEDRWHPRFEVGALRRIDGQVEVRRGTGFVDNGRLVQVDVAAPSSCWSRLHDLLWPCGVCFSLVKPTYRRQVEPTQRHGGPLVAFELPQSWHANPTTPSQTGATRWVAAPSEGIQRTAALRIDATPWTRAGAESIEARQLRVRHELWTQGISMARRVQRIPGGAAVGTAGLAGIFRADARDHEETFELRFAHRDMDGLSLDYTMVVAAPGRFPLDHMRATRALEIALTTTQTRPREKTHAA